MNHKDILSALDKQFSTGINTVFINSQKKEISFRDVTVKEQKTMTKIIIDNEDREDVLYESTLAMIQSLCLDETFDSLTLTEFDRLKILLALYRQNFFNNKVEYRCKHCDHLGKYELDFDKILDKLDNIDISDKLYDIENSSHKFSFTVGFPNVKNVRAYYKQLYKDKKDKNVVNKLSKIDYIDLFIKNFNIYNKANGDSIYIDLTEYTINETEEVLQKLPQGILLNKSGDSLMDKLTGDFLSVIHSPFSKNICGNCGKEIELNTGFSDFFLS